MFSTKRNMDWISKDAADEGVKLLCDIADQYQTNMVRYLVVDTANLPSSEED